MRTVFHQGSFRLTFAGLASGIIILLVFALGPLTHGPGSSARALSQEPGKKKAGVVGAYTFLPTIQVGNDKIPADFTGPDSPNEPRVHRIDLKDKLPKGTRVIDAWYTPHHNVPGIMNVALLDVAPDPKAKQTITLSLAGFKATPAGGRIRIHVLYIQE